MLHIVTGKINSGKTTKILHIYQKNQKGDGFVSVKNMFGSKVHSYDILKLSTNEKRKFVLHYQFMTEHVETACQIGPYHFLKDTFTYIETEIREMIAQNICPIYLDEIGLLELYDQCFHQIFSELVDSNCDVYVVIREDLIDQVINKYHIKDYEIVT